MCEAIMQRGEIWFLYKYLPYCIVEAFFIFFYIDQIPKAFLFVSMHTSIETLTELSTKYVLKKKKNIYIYVCVCVCVCVF